MSFNGLGRERFYHRRLPFTRSKRKRHALPEARGISNFGIQLVA